jgi:hypothetical protein
VFADLSMTQRAKIFLAVAAAVLLVAIAIGDKERGNKASMTTDTSAPRTLRLLWEDPLLKANGQDAQVFRSNAEQCAILPMLVTKVATDHSGFVEMQLLGDAPRFVLPTDPGYSVERVIVPCAVALGHGCPAPMVGDVCEVMKDARFHTPIGLLRLHRR